MSSEFPFYLSIYAFCDNVYSTQKPRDRPRNVNCTFCLLRFVTKGSLSAVVCKRALVV